eukprot:GFUD01015516.1.p1 GENE.GFUD01015516.1~~GFUD01015516.1.p1  ORF type:complete len:720 (+),score=233.36 GFUD01015516.1:40-2199(+)
MSGRKCQNCGSTDIESDSTRADAVCTGCGTVLESGMIVSDVTFMDNGSGGMSAIGTFVSGDRKGGSNTFGGNFMTGVGRESREVTLRNARAKIVALAQQLRLRQDHVDMSFYFYKLALAKHLTRGRKSSHVIAACVYITCRTEGTGHMLMDFSDVLQVDVYELGRTYLRLSQALCINIPAMDPCLYVIRFANNLEFGDKTHEVSMTALRLVSRMKKDWIHFGRRPSGLCGAALLIASRLHGFNRTFEDVIKVVKVHESTLRKRLNEFGETSASQLTLGEFMTADLDAMTEEMDPPCYKAAMKKDQELLDRLGEMSAIDKEIAQLENKIEKELEERRSMRRGPCAKKSRSSMEVLDSSSSSSCSSGSDVEERKSKEVEDMEKFLQAQTMGMVEDCLDTSPGKLESQVALDNLLMPPPVSPAVRTVSPMVSSRTSRGVTAFIPGLGLKETVEEYLLKPKEMEDVKDNDASEDMSDEELDISGIDDAEIDSYLMTPAETQNKTILWMKVNKEYLKEQRIKMKKELEDREEMIKRGEDPDKKKRKVYKKRKNDLLSNTTAIEAIEKLAEEKKFSTKINYDVLKNLSVRSPSPSDAAVLAKSTELVIGDIVNPCKPTLQNLERFQSQVVEGSTKRLKVEKKPNLLPRFSSEKPVFPKFDQGGSSSLETISVIESGPVEVEPEEEDDISDFSEEEEEPLLSAAELLSQQFGGGDDGGWGEEEEYY